MISVEESTTRDALAKLAQAAHVRDGWKWEEAGECAMYKSTGFVMLVRGESYQFHCRRMTMDRLLSDCFAAMDWVENGE